MSVVCGLRIPTPPSASSACAAPETWSWLTCAVTRKSTSDSADPRHQREHQPLDDPADA